MELLEKIRLSEGQIQQLDSGQLVVIPASWEEFMEFLEESTFRAEYHKNEIIVMGLASAIHEFLVSYFITLLNNYYLFNGYYVFSSNLGVTTADDKGYYNPDITVIKGTPQFYKQSKSIVTNPYLIVEVLSASTYHYDLIEKLPKYERIESLQEVVFVDRFDKAVYTFKRTADPKVWIQTIFDAENDKLLVDTLTVKLSDIFDKLPAIEE
ncbi:MAG: Uma2 family endonuclease [Spirosomataceae bacterium]